VHEAFEQTYQEHNDPVNGRLVQDRLDQRSPIVAAEKRHCAGDQHRLADDERRHLSQHEVTDGDVIFGDEEVRREHNEVEADKKEDRRRQHLAKFV